VNTNLAYLLSRPHQEKQLGHVSRVKYIYLEFES
jgi:hypothetical protein